jgi:hypothetical protein
MVTQATVVVALFSCLSATRHTSASRWQVNDQAVIRFEKPLFSPGDRVKAHSLRRLKWLNGKLGTVQQQPPGYGFRERVIVRFDRETRVHSLQAHNLRLMKRSQEHDTRTGIWVKRKSLKAAPVAQVANKTLERPSWAVTSGTAAKPTHNWPDIDLHSKAMENPESPQYKSMQRCVDEFIAATNADKSSGGKAFLTMTGCVVAALADEKRNGKKCMSLRRYKWLVEQEYFGYDLKTSRHRQTPEATRRAFELIDTSNGRRRPEGCITSRKVTTSGSLLYELRLQNILSKMDSTHSAILTTLMLYGPHVDSHL